jgi:hypothetical protein
MTVYVLDELVVPAGHLDTVRRSLEDDYVPAARRRGLQLEHLCITPPIELLDEPTTLVLWWSLPDAAGFWAMKRQTAGDEDLARWWQALDATLVSRRRRFLAPVEPRG